MAGGWQVGPQLANAQTLGANLATSTGTTFTTPTAYTQGSWTQLIASTVSDSSWVLIQADRNEGGSFAEAYTIGVGAAGAEVAVVNNLICQDSQPNNAVYFFPLAIAAGTRVAARMTSDLAYYNGCIRVTLFDDSMMSGGGASSVDTYGFSSTTNSGVAIDPGATANTKGSYTQITGSLTNDIAGFFVAFDQQGSNSGSNETLKYLVDIAVGASGAEQVILPNISMVSYRTGTYSTHAPDGGLPYIPMPMRSGTRIAARAQSDTTISPDRIVGITFYGVRQ